MDKRKRNFVYLSLAGITLALTVPFLGMALSEDMGYYGFVSRAVNLGLWPHRDFPAGQNSIGFYLNALVMRFFGETPLVFRLIYVFYALAFALVYFDFAKKILNEEKKALAATVVCCVFIFQPQIQYGLGRNNLLPALLFTVLAFRSAFFGRAFYAGVFVGIAAIYNESLAALWPAVLLAVAVSPSFHCHCEKRSDEAISYKEIDGLLRPNYGLAMTVKKLAACLAGCIIPLAVPAALLAYGHSWHEYLKNMFYLGWRFRTEGPFSSKSGNFVFLCWDFFFIYSALIFAFFSRTGERAKEEKLTSWLAAGAVAVLVFVISAAREYHLQLLVPFLVPAAVNSVFCWLDKKAKWNLAITGGLLLFINLPMLGYDYTLGLKDSLKHWNYYALGNKTAPSDYSAFSARVLDALPYRTISTLSQFPALFLAKKISASKPFIEDLTVAPNSGGLFTLRDFAAYLQKNPPDVFLGKRRCDTPSRAMGFFRLFLKDRYIEIADFKTAGEVYEKPRYVLRGWDKITYYRADVYYSLPAFARDFSLAGEKQLSAGDFGSSVPGIFRADAAPPKVPAKPYIIEAEFSAPETVPRARLSCGANSTDFDSKKLFFGKFHILCFPGEKPELEVDGKKAGLKTKLRYYELAHR